MLEIRLPTDKKLTGLLGKQAPKLFVLVHGGFEVIHDLGAQAFAKAPWCSTLSPYGEDRKPLDIQSKKHPALVAGFFFDGFSFPFDIEGWVFRKITERLGQEMWDPR